ncbi:hypothetical protein CPS_0672 [Colwellia psychrerythraea 34H]|uniref:Uncharacterized protein n=1 Tax=Colwellia psychrerythraea (strain 34H / ATCC BAA-681) TaxID=167879 RepID=Q488U2_COLP3|nr:hypothetical protein CPS_0672 [Colwellia psychrerythraea 34H]
MLTLIDSYISKLDEYSSSSALGIGFKSQFILA